jgi:peptidoglycan L-alanyl-D-glutamate endopeptidase CwlK
MTISTQSAQEGSFQYAELCRGPSLEGVGVSHLSFTKLYGEKSDLRDVIPGLSHHSKSISAKDVVIDSDMSLSDAFRNLSKDCPDSILAKQQLLRVFYFGEDKKLHQGQVVVHESLVKDVSDLFEMLVRKELPVNSVVPVSDQRFAMREYVAPRQYTVTWDDHLSMEANNSSSFNYRRIITADGEKKMLSLHALGMALDINPVHNPCYGNPQHTDTENFSKEAAAGHRSKVPHNGIYDPEHPQSMTSRHPIVLFLQERGWTWGGTWGNPLDLHHFQKVPEHLAAEVKALRT